MEITKIKKLKKLANMLLECHPLLIDAIENEKSPTLTLMTVINIVNHINQDTDNRMEIIVKSRDK